MNLPLKLARPWSRARSTSQRCLGAAWLLATGFLVLTPACAPTRDSAPAAASLTRASDGPLHPSAWTRAKAIRDFTFPWSERPAPGTTFRAYADRDRLHFAFEVEDDDIVVAEKFASESTLDAEDRVEIFFAADTGLARYWCLEIDPRGRVHDYAARHYRQFDSSWNCPGLKAAGHLAPGGYVVEASLPLATLSQLLGTPVAVGTELHIGLFRAEFRRGSRGEADDNWLSWIRPTAPKPDFHIPTAFTAWRIPGLSEGAAPTFQTRGVVLIPDDLSLKDWPERAARAGLTTIGLHHGESPSVVAGFIESAAGRDFLADCRRLGLDVEYELHAMRELLPRALFAQSPEFFRMDDQGRRNPDANLCVHSTHALEIVTTNAMRLARQLHPTTGRYFFWGDDGQPGCRCPRCRDFSDSDQALILENHLVTALRRMDPRAQLAHLAYAHTLPPPTRIRPAPGIFLEYAPINRAYDKPYVAQVGPEAKDALALLEANLKIFPAASAQVLEYWLDVSRFSGWKRPSVELPWRPDVCAADVATYAGLGIRQATTFAVWIDADHVARFGEPTAIQEYGKILR